ncbi:molybdenum cofactor guanylyltransferase MobA [Jannaschia sp. Os4]|uniref:molybdenum cofactor guanylyltransferase MobA n=1 Tax=Jannaschia sp. Os4 TaxID=2807617 RepID=UPI0031B5B6DB
MTPAVILAGGAARRMGGGDAHVVDKARLVLRGRPLIDHLLVRLRPQVGAVALNANGDPARWADLGLPVLPDTVPGRPGPLAGVLAGMEWAAGQGATHVVSAAADTPFPPVDLVERLRAGGDLVLAATDRPQPTFGLWPVRLADDLRAALEGGLRKVTHWTDRHGAATARFPEGSFTNVNTPDDLAALEAAP